MLTLFWCELRLAMKWNLVQTNSYVIMNYKKIGMLKLVQSAIGIGCFRMWCCRKESGLCISASINVCSFSNQFLPFYSLTRHCRIPKLGTILRVNDFCVHIHGISRCQLCLFNLHTRQHWKNEDCSMTKSFPFRCATFLPLKNSNKAFQ